jgi:hypothetical protein
MTSAEVAWSFYNAIESGDIPTGLTFDAPGGYSGTMTLGPEEGST